MESKVSAGAAPASALHAGAEDVARTRALLPCGVVVGPLYLAVGLIQAFVRDGFDFARHPLSVLANGPGGWVQTANFVVSGALVIAAAVGFARALRPSRATAWFLGVYGAGMLLAAVFPADPVDGFPPGTPEGMPTTVSPAGMLHFAAGGIGFLALAIACFVAAAAFSRRRESTIARVSLFAGVAIVAGFFSPMVLPVPAATAGIWFSVVVGWVWLAFTSLHLARTIGRSSRGRRRE